MSDDIDDNDDDFEDLEAVADVTIPDPLAEPDDIIAEFEEDDFDEDFDDDFEEEIEGEYALEDDKYGDEFRAEFGHLDIDINPLADKKNAGRKAGEKKKSDKKKP